MAFNENIKKQREKKGITQQKLAERLFVSRQTVSRWESGSRCPDLIMAKKLAEEFGISIDELLSEDADRDFADISSIHHKLAAISSITEEKRLQEQKKKVLEGMLLAGEIVLALSIFLIRFCSMQIPLWIWGVEICVVVVLYVAYYRALTRTQKLI